MSNDENNVEKKELKFKKKKIFSKVPKKVKLIFVIIIILLILYLGIMYSSHIMSQTKTTKLGLKDVGELVTQTAYLSIIQDNKEHRELFNLFEIPFTESRQIFSYDIEIDASVDFTQVSYTHKKEKNEIVVKLPHAKIYKATLQTDSLKVYLDQESLFSRIDLTEHNEALKTMEEQGIKDAEENGILDAADKNAQRIIDGMIKSNNEYKDCNIIYEYIGGENG